MTNGMNGAKAQSSVGRMLALGFIMTLALGLISSAPSTAAVSEQAQFRATFDAPSASVVEVIQQAQASDYWVRIQTGQDVTYFKGDESCPSCDPANEAEFFQRPQLIADGEMFWLRLANDRWELNLRPAADATGTYALFVAPRLPDTELSDEMLTQVDDALAPFNVLPNDATSLDFAAYSQPSDPEPPQGLNLAPVLYGLLNAPDWTEAAAERDVTRSGLRAVVEAELSSSSAELPSDLDLIVESRSGDTAQVQVLIPQLDDLAENPNIREVRSVGSS